jgi:hypothetical protein
VVTDLFIFMWTTFCSTIADSLPTTSPFDSSGGASWSMFSAIDYFLPIHELMSIFAGVFLLGGPMTIVSLVIWVLIGVVRGGATKA